MHQQPLPAAAPSLLSKTHTHAFNDQRYISRGLLSTMLIDQFLCLEPIWWQKMTMQSME